MRSVRFCDQIAAAAHGCVLIDSFCLFAPMLRVGSEGDRSCGLLLKDAGASRARSHAEHGNDKTKSYCVSTSFAVISIFITPSIRLSVVKLSLLSIDRVSNTSCLKYAYIG